MLLAARLRRPAAVLHPPHLRGHQRQPHRRPDRRRDRAPSSTRSMPRPRDRAGPPPPDPAAWSRGSRRVLSDASGYVRFIDMQPARRPAKRYRREAQGAAPRRPLRPRRRAAAAGRQGRPPDARAAPPPCARAFDLGPSRTLQQDVEFGILQIVDIALKAISPAVNDPSTAITCVDQLSRILIRFASREPPETVLYDPPGVVRVSIAWIGFERLLASAFEQIRALRRRPTSPSACGCCGPCATSRSRPPTRRSAGHWSRPDGVSWTAVREARRRRVK